MMLAVFLRVVTLPDDGRLVAAGVQVAVQAVVGDVQLAAFEPLDVEVVGVEAVVGHFVPLLGPGDELFGLLRPESLRIVDGLFVHRLVLSALMWALAAISAGISWTLISDIGAISSLRGCDAAGCCQGFRTKAFDHRESPDTPDFGVRGFSIFG